MLLDTHAGGEFTIDIASASGAATGLRFLGMNAPGAGLWCLPEIGPDVPQSLSTDKEDQQRLAQFSLQLHKQGVRLLDQEFTTLKAAIAPQILNTANLRDLGPQMQLPLHVCLGIETEGDARYITLRGCAESNLSVFSLKATVERLNQVQAGLGWYVTDAVQMSHAANLRLYEPSYFGTYAEMLYFYGAESDEEFAAMALEGEDPTPEDMAQFLEDTPITRARVVESFGGHAHLLVWGEPAKPVKASQIQWASLTPQDAKLLKAAQQFIRQAKKVSKLTAPFEERDTGADFGALAIIVWDDPDIGIEIMDAAERDSYECGEGAEIIFDLRADIDKPETWPALITAYKAQMGLYAQLCTFLRLLPEKEI